MTTPPPTVMVLTTVTPDPLAARLKTSPPIVTLPPEVRVCPPKTKLVIGGCGVVVAVIKVDGVVVVA